MSEAGQADGSKAGLVGAGGNGGTGLPAGGAPAPGPADGGAFAPEQTGERPPAAEGVGTGEGEPGAAVPGAAVKEMIAAALLAAEQKRAAEAAEALELSKLTEAQKKERALEKREAALLRRELRAEAIGTLAEKGLPAALAEALNYESAEACAASLAALESAFGKALEGGIQERLKGAAPAGGEAPKGLTLEEVKKMSRGEIAKNFVEVEKFMMGQ